MVARIFWSSEITRFKKARFSESSDMTSHFVQVLIDALNKRGFRPYRKFPHLSVTNSVTRQGGSIDIIQVTVYSFTVPALKLMKVKLCLFLATTAHCHDRAAIKIHIIITYFTRIFNDHLIFKKEQRSYGLRKSK